MPPLAPRFKRFLRGSRRDNKSSNEEKPAASGPEPSTTLKAESIPPGSPSPLIAPKTTAEPPSAEVTPDQQYQVDPWTRAFEVFQERNDGQEVLTTYKAHLASFHGNFSDHDSSILGESSVKGTVNKLLEDRESRQWKISIGKNDIKIRSQFEKLAKFLLWSDGFVKTAVSTQPYAALAWSGVSLVLQISTTGMSQNGDMLEGFNTILDLQMYWQIFEQQYLGAQHQQSYKPVIEPLAKLYSYMIEYQAQVLHHLASSQASRAWADIRGSSCWSGCIENIKKLDEFCRGFVSIGKSSEIRKYREEQLQVLLQTRDFGEKILQHMVDHEKDAQERNILDEFAKAAGDYMRYKDRNPMRVAGTCEWFLQDERFTKWNSSRSSDLLWVTAQPGCGKSVLTKSLIDEGRLDPQTTFTITSDSVITSQKPIVAYFFFKDGGEGKMDASHALSALLHQILTLTSTSHAINHVLPFHRAHGTTLISKPSELWQILIDSATGSEATEIICVLDALDECDKDSRRWILERLESFYSDKDIWSKSSLKFLITSRPISQLEYCFDNFPKSAAYMRLNGDEKHERIREEIDLFIDVEVDVLTRKFSDRTRSAEKIKKRLKGMKNRTYLWLYLTLDYIKSDPAKFARPSDVERLLSHLPESVSEAYETMLSGKWKDQRTEILLQLVLGAERPLTLIEASIALTLGLQERRIESHETLMDEIWSPEAFKEVVKDLCGLFVSIQDSSLSFIHQTAREFLTTKPEEVELERKDSRWQGRFSTQQPHGTMLRICLDYLLIPDIGGPPDAGVYLAPESIPVWSHQFLSYSANNWHYHLTRCEDGAFDAHLDRVRILCDSDSRSAEPWTSVHLSYGLFAYRNSGWTSLCFAAYLGLDKFACLLLEEGVDINEGVDKPLQLAAQRGHEEMVRMLLENGANTSSEDGQFEEALLRASSNGFIGVVRLLLDHAPDSNDQFQVRGRALTAAAKSGHDNIIEMLLNYKADANSDMARGVEALQAAAMNGNGRLVNILLRHGVNVNCHLTASSSTVLQAAVLSGDESIVKNLIENGAEVDAQSDEHGTALQVAAHAGHQGIFDLLLRHGANVRIEGNNSTALHAASAAGNQQMVEILLESGASVDGPNEYIVTPLQRASRHGHGRIVEILLSRGASINTQRGWSGTAALFEGSLHRHIVEILLKHGADVDSQVRDGATALQRASEEGCQDVVNLLLSYGADVNAQDNFGVTGLHRASLKGYQDTVQILLNHGAEINLQDLNGQPALSWAAITGQTAIVKLLLDRGANVNLSSDGCTALQGAASGGYDAAVKILLDRQADFNVVHCGQTALYKASINGHFKIVKMLLEHGADINLGGNSREALLIAAGNGYYEVVETLLNGGVDRSTEEGYEPELFNAVESGNLRTLELFLDRGVDVNHEYDGKTPLLIAVETWQQNVVELLLDRGADVNTKPVLHQAAANGLPRMVEVLLDHGADTDLQDEYDHTALYYAAEGGHERVVEILLEHESGFTDAAVQVAMENHNMNIVKMLEKCTRPVANHSSVTR